jgi:trigger factor
MQVIVSEPSMCERTLEVTVPPEQVEGAYQKAFSRAVKRLRLPGFRPGKVPIPMAKKYIGDENLGSDVVDEVVPKAYMEALKQNNLQPISQPRWELVQRERGKELIFKVSFEVKPQLPIENYKGVTLKNEREDITDERVEQSIDELRNSQAKVVDLAESRPLQENDLALVDYRSTLNGETVEGGAASNYLMEVKREHFIPGFVDQLIGLEAGQEKEFNITFPEDYPNADLAGKEVQFHFKLDRIKVRELPEATDDFAKAVSPHQSIDDLRKDIRERLEAAVERKVREQVAIKIIDKLLPQVSNEVVPRSLHQYRTQVELRRRLQQLEQAGLTSERYLQDRNLTQQQWVGEMSVMGMLESRVEILLESIARTEGLEPTDAEIEELMQVEAQNRNMSVAQLRQAIDQEGSNPLIRYALLRAKVMDFLYDNAQVEFVPPGTVIEEEQAPALDGGEAAPTEEEKPKAKKSKKAAEEAPAEESAAEEKPKAKKAKKTEDEGATEAPASAEGEEKPKKRSSKKKTEEEA